MKIENTVYNRSRNYQYTPAFNGLGVKSLEALNPKKYLSSFNQDKFLNECYYMGRKIGVQTETLADMLQPATSKRRSFMYSLTENYNAQNFLLGDGLKENPKYLLNVYNAIEKPNSQHFNIVYNSQMPFKTLEQIFKNATSKESLSFIQTIQHEMPNKSNATGKLILDMLESPHRESFIKNLKDYKSYLALNSQKPTCIEDLNKLISSGKYNPKTYDDKLLFTNIMDQKLIKDSVGKYEDIIEKNLTRENGKFLKHFCFKFLAYRKGLTEEDNLDIIKMFTTTTPKNINLRIRLINKFGHYYSQKETGVSDIKAMKTLCDHIDSNPHTANFVEKALNQNIKVESIENLNKIISAVDPLKAEIFHKNIARIVRYTTPEERSAVLATEIENPFFPVKKINSGIKREVVDTDNIPNDNRFEKFAKYLENKFNIMKYNRIAKDQPEIIKPDVVQTFDTAEDLVKAPTISETVTIPATPKIDTKLKLSKSLKSSPEARKLQVKSDVNNIIQKKLGQKTYENQSRDYGIKATAMRLKMLPEIFDSISATRKLQRASGKRPNIENKDALLLYEKITGRNRKLVRYMLKQTDKNGQQLFNIKEISALVDQTEAQIAQNKKNIPNYKAADAKAQYEEIFQKMVEEYGKLKRPKKHA